METAYLIEPPKEKITDNTFFDHELPELIQNIKNDCGWKNGDLKSVVIINDINKKVILTALHPNTIIDSKQTNQWLNIHVIEGFLKIQVRKVSQIVNTGQKFTLFDHVKYRLKALDKTFVLLTIGPQANS
jgi:quercetin dioxygenase-like cupin family protein